MVLGVGLPWTLKSSLVHSIIISNIHTLAFLIDCLCVIACHHSSINIFQLFTTLPHQTLFTHPREFNISLRRMDMYATFVFLYSI